MQALSNALGETYQKYTTLLSNKISTLQEKIETALALRAVIANHGEGGSLPTSRLNAVVSAATLVFSALVKSLAQTEQADKAFCRDHNLIVKAAPPNSTISALYIALAIFLDSAINSSFFLSAHLAASPFAALLVSFLISLTNATVSAFAGFYIGRYRDYGMLSVDALSSRYRRVRLVANAQYTAYLSVITFFLLTVGLVRSGENLDEVQHSLASYYELAMTPEAVFLVLINICIAAFSYHKGKTGFAHPYGGYSEIQNAVTAARDELQASYENYADEIEDIHDALTDENAAGDKTRDKAISEFNKAVKQCQNAEREYKTYVAEIEANFSSEVTRLADTQSVISGKPESVPQYLLDQFSFKDIYAPEIPSVYVPPLNSSHNKASLESLRSDALERLGASFQSATQSNEQQEQTS